MTITTRNGITTPVASLVAVVAVLVAAFAPAAVAADSHYGKQKVVYHINVAGGEGNVGYIKALKNIQNHINAVGKDNIEVKVVMHGEGLDVLKNATTDLKLQGEVTNLKNQHVAFAVCANTLKSRNIDPDKDLFEVNKEDIVPSGVAELSYLQGKGYTYIKP